MIPYMVGKLVPNPTHHTKGLVKYVPGRGYFGAVPSQNGEKNVTSPPPSIVELVISGRFILLFLGGRGVAEVMFSLSGVTFKLFYFDFVFLLQLKSRPFVQSFFDMHAPR